MTKSSRKVGDIGPKLQGLSGPLRYMERKKEENALQGERGHRSRPAGWGEGQGEAAPAGERGQNSQEREVSCPQSTDKGQGNHTRQRPKQMKIAVLHARTRAPKSVTLVPLLGGWYVFVYGKNQTVADHGVPLGSMCSKV